jgi:alpha-glucosidase (family GH31 glycosyl hydrolase)
MANAHKKKKTCDGWLLRSNICVWVITFQLCPSFTIDAFSNLTGHTAEPPEWGTGRLYEKWIMDQSAITMVYYVRICKY